MKRFERYDSIVLDRNAMSVMVQEQVDVGLGTNNLFLFRVTKLFITSWRFRCVVTEFLNNLTNTRVRPTPE